VALVRGLLNKISIYILPLDKKKPQDNLRLFTIGLIHAIRSIGRAFKRPRIPPVVTVINQVPYRHPVYAHVINVRRRYGANIVAAPAVENYGHIRKRIKGHKLALSVLFM
jgi:hypothetical protein